MLGVTRATEVTLQTQILKGQPALEALIAMRIPDWQARKMLGVARTYGLGNFPLDAGEGPVGVNLDAGVGSVGVKYIDGWFHIGDPDYSAVGR
jgi:hypothetical protein